MQTAKTHTLSKSEAEVVMVAIATGVCTTKGLAKQLNRAESTISKHRSSIIEKCNADSFAGALLSFVHSANGFETEFHTWCRIVTAIVSAEDT